MKRLGFGGSEPTERQLDDELRFHVEQQVRDYVAEGLTEEEARRRVRLEFGGFDQIKEECRDAIPLRWLNLLLHDLRYSFRLIARSPGFSAVVVSVLGLAIGLNTAVFSVMDSILFRPLPYRDAGRLVYIWGRATGIGIPDDRNELSVPELLELERLSRTFSHIAALSGTTFNLSTGAETLRVDGATVSASLFPMLGAQPEIGRLFTSEEESPGKERVALISHSLWQRAFGGDAGVIGRTVRMNGLGYQIVGVLPAWFRFEPSPEDDIWTPISFSEADRSQRGNHSLIALARIKPQFSSKQAEADAAAVTRAIIEQNPQYPYEQMHFAVLLCPLMEEVVGDVRKPLWILMAAVCSVLLIACANAAALLLSRANARRREIAIRVALGGRRARLVTQMITESLVLGAASGLAGLALACWLLKTVKVLASSSLPRVMATSLNWPIVAFTVASSLLTALIFGLAPALHATRDAADGLKEDRGGAGGRRSQRWQRALVVAEVTLSVTLLVTAGLFIRSFLQVQNVDPGFHPANVLTMRVSFRSAEDSPDVARNFYRRVFDSLSSLPGVLQVGAVSGLPLTGQGSSGTVTVDTRAVPPDQAAPEADLRVATPGYFEAMGIRLIRGRTFDTRDTESSAPCAIIDETLAAKYWPGEDPVGKRLKRGGSGSTSPWITVIGVVAHVRYRTLEAPSRTEVYTPFSQASNKSMTLAIRTVGNPAKYAEAARLRIKAIDPDQPPYMIRTMDQTVARSVARRRLPTVLLGLFAVCALLMAAVGLYGVMSYAVSRRTHEIGMRMALGANASQISRMVMRQGLALTAAGSLLGAAGSLAASRWISALLFEVRPVDLVTLTITAATVAALALIATYIPARRAMKVEPVVALRNE